MNGKPVMSADEVEMWTKAAEDIKTPQVLARIGDHNKAIVSTVATVGTLLAGLGGVTAGISITRTTFYFHGAPVIPVGALATSVLAGTAVAVALFGRRPAFAVLNTNNLFAVKDWYVKEVDRGKRAVQVASGLLIVSAFVAAITSLVAGVLAVANAQTDPRNLATLSATSGEGSAVTVQLAGAVDGLDEDEYLVVAVSSNAPAGTADGNLISGMIYPDGGGKATLNSSAQAPVGSTQVTATIKVLCKGEAAGTASADYTLTASYPKVPKPERKQAA